MKCSSAAGDKAQSSLEFAVLAGLFMVMFVGFFYIISERIIAFQIEKDGRASWDVIFKVQNEFNLALRVHDGYNRTFWVPLELYGFEYSLSIEPIGNPTEVVIEYKDRSYVAPILVNLTSDSVLVRGTNRIEKVDGNITVSPGP